MRTIAPYAIGGMLVSAGAGGVGTLVILLGVIRDWRFWLLVVLGVGVGFWWD